MLLYIYLKAITEKSDISYVDDCLAIRVCYFSQSFRGPLLRGKKTVFF